MNSRKRLTKDQRKIIYQKMNGHCAYCGCKIDLSDMQVDHVMPLRKGGADEPENMLPACRSCNHYKSTYTLEQFRDTIRKIPYKLAKTSVIYRIALRYGLVVPYPRPIKFYFETKEDVENE